ncbi:MAG: hypothetical protein NT136_02370 [Candidatus Moranbacteria bacterium]|nr:hypothetical protein [Candidatus Moranbacteria bacterium]
MRLLIKIKDKKVSIQLYYGKKTLSRLSFTENYNLSEKLLPEIDKLLKKNKLIPRDIKKVIVQTDTPKSFTTSRIAQAVTRAYNFATKNKTKNV